MIVTRSCVCVCDDYTCRYMSVLELEQYITSKSKKGLSAEYYKIKNTPLSGPSEVFRYTMCTCTVCM